MGFPEPVQRVKRGLCKLVFGAQQNPEESIQRSSQDKHRFTPNKVHNLASGLHRHSSRLGFQFTWSSS
jgi:hypothetical protein